MTIFSAFCWFVDAKSEVALSWDAIELVVVVSSQFGMVSTKGVQAGLGLKVDKIWSLFFFIRLSSINYIVNHQI